MTSNGKSQPAKQETADVLDEMFVTLDRDKVSKLERRADRLETAMAEFDIEANNARRKILEGHGQRSADEVVRAMF